MKVLYFVWDVLKMLGSGLVNILDTVVEARKLQADMEARRYIDIYKSGSKSW